MIKKAFAIGVAAALGFAALLTPAAVTAKGFAAPHASYKFGPGFFARPASLYHRHAFKHRHRQADDFPIGYGYVWPNATVESDAGAAYPVDFVATPAAGRCRYEREVVTVRAESGGTREITITRC